MPAVPLHGKCRFEQVSGQLLGAVGTLYNSGASAASEGRTPGDAVQPCLLGGLGLGAPSHIHGSGSLHPWWGDGQLCQRPSWQVPPYVCARTWGGLMSCFRAGGQGCSPSFDLVPWQAGCDLNEHTSLARIFIFFYYLLNYVYPKCYHARVDWVTGMPAVGGRDLMGTRGPLRNGRIASPHGYCLIIRYLQNGLKIHFFQYPRIP